MKYNYNDVVRISPDAPSELRPNDIGSVCGMRTIMKGTDSTSPIMLYIVEYSDGASSEVPEHYLLPFKLKNP